MKSYRISELQEFELQCLVLRACPQISMATANLINKNYFKFKEKVKEYQEEVELLVERRDATETLEGKEEINNLFRELNKKRYEVDITFISDTEFGELNGERELNINNSIQRLPYREAYFILLNEIITINT